MNDQAMFLEELGKQIKVCRLKAQLSQAQLAGMCDLEKSNMSRLESGKANPTIITIRKLSVAMNMRLSALLEGLE